jgi:hypothetical protein
LNIVFGLRRLKPSGYPAIDPVTLGQTLAGVLYLRFGQYGCDAMQHRISSKSKNKNSPGKREGCLVAHLKTGGPFFSIYIKS